MPKADSLLECPVCNVGLKVLTKKMWRILENFGKVPQTGQKMVQGLALKTAESPQFGGLFPMDGTGTRPASSRQKQSKTM